VRELLIGNYRLIFEVHEKTVYPPVAILKAL
jgi:hypothetical protein